MHLERLPPSSAAPRPASSPFLSEQQLRRAQPHSALVVMQPRRRSVREKWTWDNRAISLVPRGPRNCGLFSVKPAGGARTRVPCDCGAAGRGRGTETPLLTGTGAAPHPVLATVNNAAAHVGVQILFRTTVSGFPDPFLGRGTGRNRVLVLLCTLVTTTWRVYAINRMLVSLSVPSTARVG